MQHYYERGVFFWIAIFIYAFIINPLFCEDKASSREPCTYCDATGLQDCSMCYGEGTKDCSYCYSAGEKTCQRCYGSARISAYVGHHVEDGYQHISTNGISGYHQVVGGYVDTTCPDCHWGKVACSHYQCDNGQVECNYCYGEGVKTCSYCHGEGLR